MTIWNVTVNDSPNFVKAETAEIAVSYFAAAEVTSISEATAGEAKAYSDGEEQTYSYVILDQLKRINGQLEVSLKAKV